MLRSFAVCGFPVRCGTAKFRVASSVHINFSTILPSSDVPVAHFLRILVAKTTSYISRHCHTTVMCGGVQYNTTSQRTCPACNLPATVDPTWIRPHIRDPAVVTRLIFFMFPVRLSTCVTSTVTCENVTLFAFNSPLLRRTSRHALSLHPRLLAETQASIRCSQFPRRCRTN